jgi:midasin (ATPase involved in ribosome maturation)
LEVTKKKKLTFPTLYYIIKLAFSNLKKQNKTNGNTKKGMMAASLFIPGVMMHRFSYYHIFLTSFHSCFNSSFLILSFQNLLFALPQLLMRLCNKVLLLLLKNVPLLLRPLPLNSTAGSCMEIRRRKKGGRGRGHMNS